MNEQTTQQDAVFTHLIAQILTPICPTCLRTKSQHDGLYCADCLRAREQDEIERARAVGKY